MAFKLDFNLLNVYLVTTLEDNLESFMDFDVFFVILCVQGHIAMGSLWVEEPVHTSWSRFCTVNHRASASNYQLSNMKCPC